MADARRTHAQPLEIHHRGLVAELHAALFVEHQGCVRHAVQAVRQEASQVAHAGQGAAQFADAMFERGAVAEGLRAGFVQHRRILALQTAQFVVHVAQRGLLAAPAPHRVAERDAQQRRAGGEPQIGLRQQQQRCRQHGDQQREAHQQGALGRKPPQGQAGQQRRQRGEQRVQPGRRRLIGDIVARGLQHIGHDLHPDMPLVSWDTGVG